MSFEAAEALFSELDVNGDGNLSLDELAVLTTNDEVGGEDGTEKEKENEEADEEADDGVLVDAAAAIADERAAAVADKEALAKAAAEVPSSTAGVSPAVAPSAAPTAMTSSQQERFDGLTERLASAEAASAAAKTSSNVGALSEMSSSQQERFDGLTQRLASAEAASTAQAGASNLTPAQAERLQGLLARLAAAELAAGVNSSSTFTAEQIARLKVCAKRVQFVCDLWLSCYVVLLVVYCRIIMPLLLALAGAFFAPFCSRAGSGDSCVSWQPWSAARRADGPVSLGRDGAAIESSEGVR